MTSIREEPFFNLKAVVQQTGLKPDTLRAWERRYGLPTPERSEGGHRLYSRRDIDIIKWLIARQQEGLSISRAVDLWQQLEASGRDPLRAPMPIGAPTPVRVPQAMGETIVELRESWIDACLRYDERLAEQILTQAFALYPPEVVSVDLLQKAVAEIGDSWYQGDVTVQQEHFCSGLAIRRLEALIMAAPPPTRPGRILAACPPGENHVIGLLLLTFLLRRKGWEVVYLGANVPRDRLELTISAAKPQLVILAAQRLQSAATLLEMARVLEGEEIPLAYGGRVFNLIPEIREHIPGHFLGERLDLAPQVVERLMTAPRLQPAEEAVPAEYHHSREYFQDNLGLIETELASLLADRGFPVRYLPLANQELAQNIIAALSLGDMNYLGTDLDWITGLIENRTLPADSLNTYLDLYRQVVDRHLNDRGAPIVDWLERVIAGNGPGPQE
jgi:DNA-binding transcriptional MerR regulator